MLATFIALGGTAYAASQLPANSVGTRQLRPNAVTLTKIDPGARTALRSGPAGGDLIGRFPNPRIKPGAITARALAPPPAETAVPYSKVMIIHGEYGWTDFGAPYSGGGYYRDNEGVVHLSGVSKSFYGYVCLDPAGNCGGPPSQNLCESGFFHAQGQSTMFVLPPGYLPRARLIFAVDSGGAEGRVDVTPEGQVICVNGAGDQYVSLDGISFRARS